jgi:hypothetical protein
VELRYTGRLASGEEALLDGPNAIKEVTHAILNSKKPRACPRREPDMRLENPQEYADISEVERVLGGPFLETDE